MSAIGASRYDNALQWIRKHAEERMQPFELLREYFPHGPAPASDKMIDVIAANDTSELLFSIDSLNPR